MFLLISTIDEIAITTMSAARRPHNRTATKLFESGDFSTGGWEQFKDDATGDFFFFHTETGETTWDEPFPGAADQLSHKRQKTLDGVTNPMNAHRHKGGNGIAGEMFLISFCVCFGCWNMF